MLECLIGHEKWKGKERKMTLAPYRTEYRYGKDLIYYDLVFIFIKT